MSFGMTFCKHKYCMFINYKDVSENNGTPKSSISIGFSIINHPFWDTTICGNTHKCSGYASNITSRCFFGLQVLHGSKFAITWYWMDLFSSDLKLQTIIWPIALKMNCSLNVIFTVNHFVVFTRRGCSELTAVSDISQYVSMFTETATLMEALKQNSCLLKICKHNCQHDAENSGTQGSYGKLIHFEASFGVAQSYCTTKCCQYETWPNICQNLHWSHRGFLGKIESRRPSHFWQLAKYF